MRASAPSANVISAKARAMYGASLKAENYIDLLGCHSVSEAAAYLKSRTSYAAVLADINVSTVHRGHLETLLRRKLFNDYASLSRYDAMVGMRLSGYIIRLSEVQQIVRCLQLMTAGRADEFFFSMPLFFASHSRLDLIRMGHAKTQEELQQALEETPYARILAQFPPQDGHIQVTRIETALNAYVIEALLAVIDETDGELHSQLVDLCGMEIDTQNVSRILRLKQYFHASPEQIRENLLPSGRCISGKIMDAMIHASTPEEVLRLFWKTRAGKILPEGQRTYTYDLYHRVPYFNARRHIHFSVHPMVVLLSYMILMNVELDDIINIIEGIRYGIPPEEIKPMLVLVEP